MNFHEIRSSFQIFIVDSDRARRQTVQDILSRESFKYEVFDHEDDLLGSARHSPPHIILAHFDSQGFSGDAFFQRAQHILPETRFIVLCEARSVDQALVLLKRGAYDVIVYPTLTSSQLVSHIDHAIEADYFKYLSEQTESELEEAKNHLKESEAVRENQLGELSVHREYTQSQPLVDRQVELEARWLKLNQWLDKVVRCSTIDECLEHLMFSLAESRSNAPALYLKYVSSFKTLVAAQSFQIERRKVRGLGVDLKQIQEGTVDDYLEHPENLTSLKEMMRDVLGAEKFFPVPMRVGTQTLGILVFLIESQEWSGEDQIKKALTLQVCSKILLQKKLHMERMRDETTEVLDRHHFLIKLGEEITRSRRTRLPVSLVVCSVDRFEDLHKSLDKDDADLMLKMLANLITTNSRVNDIVGRISTDEFAIILPHTGKRGGAIKAERLRRIVQSADFSEAIKAGPKVTMSLGISEYPTLCSDADELLQTSDDALFQVKKSGENRVCLASAPQNFTPDFPVQD